LVVKVVTERGLYHNIGWGGKAIAGDRFSKKGEKICCNSKYLLRTEIDSSRGDKERCNYFILLSKEISVGTREDDESRRPVFEET